MSFTSSILTTEEKSQGCLISNCIPETSKVPCTGEARDNKGSFFEEGAGKLISAR